MEIQIVQMMHVGFVIRVALEMCVSLMGHAKRQWDPKRGTVEMAMITIVMDLQTAMILIAEAPKQAVQMARMMTVMVMSIATMMIVRTSQYAVLPLEIPVRMLRSVALKTHRDFQ
jgi:hypothetical protein